MDDEDARLLGSLHDGFLEAFKSGSRQSLAAIFSETAVVLPPRGGILVGRDKIATFWLNAERIQDFRFEPKAIEKLGQNVMREAGLLLIGTRQADGEIRTQAAKYMSVWTQTENGWHLDSHLWSLREGGGARQAGQVQAGQVQAGRGGQGRVANRGGAGNGFGRESERPNRGHAGFQSPAGGQLQRGNPSRDRGPRAQKRRANHAAPMIPRLD